MVGIINPEHVFLCSYVNVHNYKCQFSIKTTGMLQLDVFIMQQSRVAPSRLIQAPRLSNAWLWPRDLLLFMSGDAPLCLYLLRCVKSANLWAGEPGEDQVTHRLLGLWTGGRNGGVSALVQCCLTSLDVGRHFFFSLDLTVEWTPGISCIQSRSCCSTVDKLFGFRPLTNYKCNCNQ